MDWEKWIAEQDESVRKAYEEHVAGLNTALKTERDARKVLSDQVKGLTDKANKADDATKQLEALQAQLTEKEGAANTSAQALTETQGKLTDLTKRFGFFQEAAAKGISNPDNAFLIAQGKNLVGDDGKMDWDAFAKAAPEQFGSTSAGNPARGSGKETDPFTAALMRGAGIEQGGK